MFIMWFFIYYIMFIMWYFFMLKYRKRQMWECPTSAFGLFVAIMTLLAHVKS